MEKTNLVCHDISFGGRGKQNVVLVRAKLAEGFLIVVIVVSVCTVLLASGALQNNSRNICFGLKVERQIREVFLVVLNCALLFNFQED